MLNTYPYWKIIAILFGKHNQNVYLCPRKLIIRSANYSVSIGKYNNFSWNKRINKVKNGI